MVSIVELNVILDEFSNIFPVNPARLIENFATVVNKKVESNTIKPHLTESSIIALTVTSLSGSNTFLINCHVITSASNVTAITHILL